MTAQAQQGQQVDSSPVAVLVAKVKTVNQDSLVVSPVTGGPTVTVKVADKTRIFKERQPAKLSDIKPNDMIICRGAMVNDSLQAVSVNVPNAEMARALENPELVQRMQQGGGRLMFGPGMSGNPGVSPEDMGKKFILGEVKAINETKLTIARPDGQTQDIEVDENTSFKKGNESITLPDIKPGDFVRGRGELKDGVFVPKELMVGRPQMRMMMRGADAQPQEVTSGDKPASPQQPPKN
jgi:hypothetical protein